MNLTSSGQVNPAHDALISTMIQLIPLLVEAFPGTFNAASPEFTPFWQLASFYKKQRKAAAEAKQAESDARKAVVDKKARDDASKKEASARERALKVLFLFFVLLVYLLIHRFLDQDYQGQRQRQACQFA